MPTPEDSNANLVNKEPAPYTPRVNASETSQAQHQVANDAPADVNVNACLARNYGETASRRADSFERAAARHDMLAEAVIAQIAKKPMA